MSAMVETLDAQMTDYSANDDVQMHTHSDPWTQEDGTMEDDSFTSFNQTEVSKLPSMDSIIPIEASASLAFSTISTSVSSLPMGEEQAVEIEMEEDFEAHEYDMVDADEDVEEIRDIEVQDAQSGISHPDIVAPQISFTLSSETSASVAEITTLITPTPSAHGASRHSPALTHDSTTDQPPLTQETVQSFEHTQSSDVVLTQSTSDVSVEVPGPVVEQAQDIVEVERRESAAVAHLATEAAQSDVQHVAAPEAPERATSPPLSELAHTSHPTAADEVQDTSASLEQSEDAAPVDPHDDHEDTAAEGSNPHEISEGVYIEPPPGVILEVPSSQHSYSLFNRPSYSGHTTPSREGADAGDDSVVLLQDRPTLFYEPIFSVFEALREEEPFHGSSDLRELELMFSIPSLKLVISEDNVYARQSETSLHELSMLHETFGDSGPLRVRIQLQPRFIIRFSELQSALEQSALGPDEEEGDADDDGDVAGTAEDTPTEHVNLEAPHAETVEHEVPPHPEQEENSAVANADDQRSELAHGFDLNTAKNTPLTQDASAREAEEVFEHQDLQSAAQGMTEATGQVEEQLQEEEEAHEQKEEPQDEQEEAEVKAEVEVEVKEEVEVVVNVEAPERHVDVEDCDGEHGEDDDDGGHIDDEGFVEYVEEFEEDEEHYEDDYEDSDATKTPGDENNLEAADAADVAYDLHVEESSLVEGQAVLSSPLEDSQGTDNYGLVNDRDPSPHAILSEHPGSGQDAGHGDEQEEHGHDEQTEAAADGETGHVEPVEEFPDFSELPELPEEDDEFWDDELDGEGEVDASWSNEYEAGEAGEQNEESVSNDSVTLSSKGSKRTYSEVDDGHEENGDKLHPSIPTPEKRTRLQ